MNALLGVVKASKLYRFCRTPYPTFQAWVRAGWFGEEKRKVGEGNQRSYTFAEAVLARIIAEISPLIQSHNRAAGKDLRDGLRKVVADSVREAREGRVLDDYYTLRWTGKEFHLSKMRHNPIFELVTEEQWKALTEKRKDGKVPAGLYFPSPPHPHYAKIKKDAGRATAWLTIAFREIYEETVKLFEEVAS